MIHGYTFFGAHAERRDGRDGYVFRTWAPHAKRVSVVGEFNGWTADADPMQKVEREIWEGFVPGLQQYDLYKFAVTGQNGQTHLKADPYAFHAETRPGTASKLYDLGGYVWNDKAFREERRRHKSGSPR